MRCCTRFRSSLSGKAASVYILSLYSRAWSCSTARAVNIDFRQGHIGVSTDVPRRVLHRVRRVFHPPLPRAARVGTGWASAAFNFALRSFVNAACSLHGRGRAPRLPRPARCRSCRPPSDSARCRVPARFSSLICCRCAVCCALSKIAVRRLGTTRPRSRRRIGHRAEAHSAELISAGAKCFQRINNSGVLRSQGYGPSI